jgi:hypothetical protein
LGYRGDRWAGSTLLTASTTMRSGIAHQYSTAGGAIAQTLPQTSSLIASASLWVLLRTAGNNLTVSPFAGDTINGSASGIVFSSAGDSGLFVRDQTTTNWLLVAKSRAGSAPQWTPVVALVDPYNASFGEIVQLTSAPWTVNLPAITPSNIGLSVFVKLNADDPDLVTVAPNGADTIEGLSSFTFSSDRGGIMFVPATGNWIAL